MTNQEVKERILNRLNNNIKIEYRKYEKENLLNSFKYFPEKWGLLLITEPVNKKQNIKLQESYKLNSYQDGIEVMEEINHRLIVDKTVYCENESEQDYYLILQWN